MTVTDDVTGTVSNFHVTRDGPVINSSNPVNEAGLWSLLGYSDTYNVDNTAFEPSGNTGNYKGVPLAYPASSGLEAFALRNPDGSDGLATDSGRGTGDATGVMIHVGGEYTNGNGDNRITGSLGCFGLCGKDSGNAGVTRFINDVVRRREINRRAGAGTDVLINVDKRQNVNWNWEVNKKGNPE